ncbi:MAG TPA: hypothetical protein VFS47_06480, partial [Steroidobacteraceae bacterium]|nr:hypothetical protein [Steroidobacteraceae bacterium]
MNSGTTETERVEVRLARANWVLHSVCVLDWFWRERHSTRPAGSTMETKAVEAVISLSSGIQLRGFLDTAENPRG